MFGLSKHERIYAAIARGDVKTVEKILDKGYDVSSETFYGMTPILAAAIAGHVEVVDLLIRRGADFTKNYGHHEATNNRYCTLLHVAAEHGHKALVERLLEHDKYDHTLKNRIDGHRNTALHCAAAGGHKDIVEILLKNGFDPGIKGMHDKLAIGYAFQGQHQDIVDLLESIKKPQPKAIEAAPAAPPAKWKKVSDSSVATVSNMPDLGYQITEVFNFASRERLRIVNNLKTKADNIETTPFDALPDRRQLDEAHAALKELGGNTAGFAGVKPRLQAPERKP